jgi:hypothetical protein
MARFPTLLVRLYPPAWRARYGDEMLAMLEGQPLGGRGLADLVWSAVREQLWPSVGPRNSGRAVAARVATALVLSGIVFVLSLSAMVAAASGRWQNPLAIALGFGLDLMYMAPSSALTWLGSLWLGPVLASTLPFGSLQRLRVRGRKVQGAMAALAAATAGSIMVLTVHEAWGPSLLGTALPQVLALTVGSGAIGLVSWWIAAGPANALPAHGVLTCRQP